MGWIYHSRLQRAHEFMCFWQAYLPRSTSRGDKKMVIQPMQTLINKKLIGRLISPMMMSVHPVLVIFRPPENCSEPQNGH